MGSATRPLNGEARTVMDVLSSHRSVRSFEDRPLPEGLLERLVSAGTRASTSSNMQAYSVISITDPDLKKRLAVLAADQKQIHQSAAFLVVCADVHKMLLACEMHDLPDVDIGYAEVLLLAVIDAALVMQNVAVAAESHGLGICMIGAMRNHPHEVGQALSLPRGVFAISGLCIGYPAEPGEVKPRMPLPAVLHENGYQSDDALRRLIREYDETQSAWYRDRDMHTKDARWSAVVSQRLAQAGRREAVGRFLTEQGLDLH